jgi:NAD(P)-dependent dehydrogenase (short-subunit alcohol dehydrogenase family)
MSQRAGHDSGRERIALVTGGGSGLGLAIATALARDGFTIVVAGRRAEVLEKAAADIGAAHGRSVRAIATDVSDASAVDSLFAAIDAEFGRLDLLVNNAGIFPPSRPIEEVPLAEWQGALGANLTSAFLCTQGAIRMMKRQAPRGGRIINNGSISAMTPRPNSVPYAATKHAISGLTKSTALEGRAFDIACGQIDIGNAASAMTDDISHGVLQPDGTVQPEPTMDPRHAADAVAYMASLPLDANVLFMTVMATAMPFVGRG